MVDNRGAYDLSAYKQVHRYADTDADSSAIHHTLGLGPNQAAKGNHNHDAAYEVLGHDHEDAVIKLTPTMSGISGHAFYLKKISEGTVGISGYLDVDDADTTRRDTGMLVPVGLRPLANVAFVFPQYGGAGGQYRYIVGTTGVIEFQQTAGINGTFEWVSGIWFTQ